MSGVTSRIPWNGLLEYFGIPVANLQLPASTSCPLCPKGGLRVYRDSFIDGAWYCCSSCGFRGDSLDLAAKKLKVSPEEAIAILVVNHVIDPGDADPRQMAAYAKSRRDRQRLQQIWRMGFESAHTDLDRGLLELSVSPLQDAAWKLLAKQWLRPIQIRDVRKLWPGRGLRDIPQAVVEASMAVFEDVPGRPAAALLLAGGETWEAGAKIATDTSLIMGLGSIPEDTGPLYVCPDGVTVLKVQLKSLRERRQASQLVAVRFSLCPNPIWKQLGRSLVFVDSQLTPEITREAWYAGARVWITGKPLPGLDIRQAKPAAIPSAVADLLAKTTPAKAVQFLRETRLDSATLAEFMGACDTVTRERLAPLLYEDPTQVQYGKYQIRLDGSCLYASVNGSGTSGMVSDVALKITQLYEGSQELCRGEILFGKRRIQFKDKLPKIEESPETWIRRQLWTRKLGVPFIEPKWREHMVSIGYLLGNPKTIRKLPKMGWSPTEDGVVLSSYCLKRGGTVQYYAESTRGLRFGLTPTPVPVSSAAVATIESLPGQPVLWGVAAYVTAMLLSRLSGVVHPPLWLCGDAARYYGSRFAKAMGCPHLTARTVQDVPMLQKRVDSARKHSWAVSLMVRADALRPPGLGPLGTYGMLVTVDHSLRSWELAAATDAWLLQHEGPQSEIAHAKDFIGDLIPAYLRDLAEREFLLPQHPKGLIAALYEDMADWWERVGGSTHRRDDSLFDPRESAVPCLSKFLRTVVQEVQTVPTGFYAPAAAGTICVETDLKFAVIPPAELVPRLAARRVVLDPTVFEERLRAAGALCHVTPDGRWAIPLALWKSAVVSVTKLRSA